MNGLLKLKRLRRRWIFFLCLLLVSGLLVDLHVPGMGSKLYPEGPVERKTCGALNIAAVQPVLAAKWATTVVNNAGAGSSPVKMGESKKSFQNKRG